MQSIIKPYFQIITPTGTSEEGRGTLVAFSALARSVNKFCFYKSSYEGRVARLMLNCNRTWYLEGIPEFSTNVENTAEKIQNQLKASGNEGSLFIGSSMGGFGALFYGSICNAKRIICFATEVIANIPGGRRQLNPTSPYVNLKFY